MSEKEESTNILLAIYRHFVLVKYTAPRQEAQEAWLREAQHVEAMGMSMGCSAQK